MAGKSSKNPTLLTTNATIATAWDTSDPSVGSQCKWFTQLDGSDKVKEEEERILVDDISPAEASLGATSASDGEVMVVQHLRSLTETTGSMIGKKKIGTKKVIIPHTRKTITGEVRQVPSPAALILLDTLFMPD